MPTYSYRCTECGNAFDTVQSFTDDSLTVCPSCGGKLRKLFSAVGVTFNGSGFYRNDSRAGGSSGSSDAAGTSGSSGSDTGSAKPSAPAASTPASTASSSSSDGKGSA